MLGISWEISVSVYINCWLERFRLEGRNIWDIWREGPVMWCNCNPWVRGVWVRSCSVGDTVDKSPNQSAWGYITDRENQEQEREGIVELTGLWITYPIVRCGPHRTTGFGISLTLPIPLDSGQQEFATSQGVVSCYGSLSTVKPPRIRCDMIISDLPTSIRPSGKSYLCVIASHPEWILTLPNEMRMFGSIDMAVFELLQPLLLGPSRHSLTQYIECRALKVHSINTPVIEKNLRLKIPVDFYSISETKFEPPRALQPPPFSYQWRDFHTLLSRGM